jgi:hypothetical protein
VRSGIGLSSSLSALASICVGGPIVFTVRRAVWMAPGVPKTDASMFSRVSQQ